MYKTLGDLKKDEEKDGKKKTVSYTGGEKSGMAVENPDDEQNNLKKVINRAKQQGASGGSSNGPKVKITLYRNGFCIDDGEFKSFELAENKRFLEELKEGQLPTMLRQKYKSQDIDASLEDKSEENYKAPPPPSYVAFSGSGQSMGSTSTVSSSVNLSAEGFRVDSSKPTTTLTFRFHNGTTNQVTVNTTESTANVYSYVQRVCPGNFQLIAGFPPKPVNKNSTVQAQDLCDSRITQKPI